MKKTRRTKVEQVKRIIVIALVICMEIRLSAQNQKDSVSEHGTMS
jgi:hypothetical protein